ncbi:MAG: DUF4422 domain-containing protein [Bacilli bacterium]|nr:DUF4422 domain-containing protein [Bacilli bacterium]
MENLPLKIFVVTHKEVEKPVKKPGYVYIGVGPKSGEIGVECTDATGENIAAKNPNYCELTAYYWMWKNDTSPYVGLEHYRRFFFDPYRSVFTTYIYSAEELLKMLEEHDVLVAKKTPLDSKGSSIYDHYCNQHYQGDLDKVRAIIEKDYPEYLGAFDATMEEHEASLFNMIVTSKKIFDEYCAFLFGVLMTLEGQVDISGYNSYQARIFGFLSERLLNVYLNAHPEYKKKELPVCNIAEGVPFINFCKRVFNRVFHRKPRIKDQEPNK